MLLCSLAIVNMRHSAISTLLVSVLLCLTNTFLFCIANTQKFVSLCVHRYIYVVPFVDVCANIRCNAASNSTFMGIVITLRSFSCGRKTIQNYSENHYLKLLKSINVSEVLNVHVNKSERKWTKSTFFRRIFFTSSEKLTLRKKMWFFKYLFKF